MSGLDWRLTGHKNHSESSWGGNMQSVSTIWTFGWLSTWLKLEFEVWFDKMNPAVKWVEFLPPQTLCEAERRSKRCDHLFTGEEELKSPRNAPFRSSPSSFCWCFLLTGLWEETGLWQCVWLESWRGRGTYYGSEERLFSGNLVWSLWFL